ncbi:helix-turn-helix domain-containing protein [Pseudoalteromonas sp. SMS1]|uniref:GlxA family transcriptional regulator n=1 Tax=Pseudoalteromonas sp. SMS1 TaxID=2908894 RepID=UPI001F3C3B43|nr:helix-turn-helix domain-containing protein [Pseudoalteromonas sp. SMS1]MCF2858367.1 helix-turn-helix domain-containing protein [Pseudoalteromonas sp. SMS1]
MNLTIIDYPSASQSAVYGFIEVIKVTNSVCQSLGIPTLFKVHTYKLDELDNNIETQVVALPPSTSDEFYMQKCDELNDYLRAVQRNGAILASACVGSFILANGGFLDGKFCTTHWRLAQQFSQCFPKAKLNINAIIINEGNVITAGGRMAWLDLAIEIISFYCPPTVVSMLSKEMVVDIGHREQKFYRQFMPKLDHGDEVVLCVQEYLSEHHANQILLPTLAQQFHMSARTLQRRFQKAVGLSVVAYVQKLRLHHACQYLELSHKSVVEIAYLVGYQNVGALRKLFYREYGLTPTDYRKRFTV